MNAIWLKLCKKCRHHNPDDSNRCSGCGVKWEFSILETIGWDFLGGKKYSKNWACPKCRNVNLKENKSCDRCLWTR